MDRAALSECGGSGRSISKIASADRQTDRICSSHLSQVHDGRAIVGGGLFAADKDKKLLFHDDRNAAIICPSHTDCFFLYPPTGRHLATCGSFETFMGKQLSCPKILHIITYGNQECTLDLAHVIRTSTS